MRGVGASAARQGAATARAADATAPLQARPLLLVVEDEDALVQLLRYNLEKAGFAICEARTGEDALVVAAERRPDLVLLDWMLPVTSGIEVCRRFRRMPDMLGVPIIMLTARGEEGDRVRGLDTGVDDYIAKPFSMSELIARVRAVLRRARPTLMAEVLQHGGLTMDMATHRVSRGDRDIHLGPTEYRLLRHFLQSPGRIFTREQLLDSVWGHDVTVELRTVDVHVRRLRKAVNGPGEQDLIRTVRSAGYGLDERG